MLSLNGRRPFWVPFDFSAIPVSSASEVKVPVSQTHMLVHGLATFNTVSRLTGFNTYTLEILSRRGGWRLMDEPVFNMALESDARTFFRFSSPLYVPPNTDITVRLVNPSATDEVTVQPCLVGELIPEKPVITKAPFMYSFVRNLGFADSFFSASNPTSTLTYDQWPTQTEAKPALLHDFELCAITLDDRTNPNADGEARNYLLTIKDSLGRRLFRSLVLCGNAFGGFAQASFNAYGVGLDPFNAGFPCHNVLQGKVDPPFVFKKGTQMNVEISICPFFESTLSIHDLQQNVNAVLIGNHLYDPAETA